MTKKLIQIKKIDGDRLEIHDAGSVRIFKKNYDERHYCELVDDFFKQAVVKNLSAEEQIIARGYLAWNYFWPTTIYQELLQNYPIDEFDYVIEKDSRLNRYLLWLKEKPSWSLFHWFVYRCFYLPALKLRLKFHHDDVLVGFTIKATRWKGFRDGSVLKIGGGNWFHSTWFDSFPLLHPRRYPVKGTVQERTLAHVKNMKLSAKYLKGTLAGFKHEMHFWDDFNFTFPLRLAAGEAGVKIIVHQHAPSFSPVHVTGQILKSLPQQNPETWSCWDQDWQRVAEKLTSALCFDSNERFIPEAETGFYDKNGTVVFPWEAFCDNSAKRSGIRYAIEQGLQVAIKLRPGENEVHGKMSFAVADIPGVSFFHEWEELKNGVRCVVGAQTALIYQCYSKNIPVMVLEYLSHTYTSWLDTTPASEVVIRCRSEEQLLLALRSLG